MQGKGSGAGEPCARIERGDVNPVEPVFTSPHQVRVGTWPLRFRALASAPARQAPEMVSCILATPVRCRSVEDCASSSFIDPDPVPFSPAPKRKRSGASILPGLSAVARKRLWNPWSESRTDPLETPVSLGFRAAVSLGLIKLAPNAGSSKGSIRACCAGSAQGRCISLLTSVDGRDFC